MYPSLVRSITRVFVLPHHSLIYSETLWASVSIVYSTFAARNLRKNVKFLLHFCATVTFFSISLSFSDKRILPTFGQRASTESSQDQGISSGPLNCLLETEKRVLNKRKVYMGTRRKNKGKKERG